MCVDCKDMNKDCLKDNYLLSSINQLIDPTASHQVISFPDTFSRYHQISMNTSDITKTAFIKSKKTYAYIKMPFDLKNIGETFQCMVNKVFKKKIGPNMEY